MANLPETIREQISPLLISRAAVQFRETEGGIAKATGALIPVVLGGLLNKTENRESFDRAFSLLRGFDAGVLENIPWLLEPGNLAQNDPKDAAGRLLGFLYGARVPAITNAVAAYSGTRTATVSALLGLVGPVAMAVLSQKIQTEGLNAGGLAHLLTGEKKQIAGLLPNGLGVITGVSSMDTAAREEEEATTGIGWFWPLLLLVVLGLGIMYYFRYCAPVVETPVRSEIGRAGDFGR